MGSFWPKESSALRGCISNCRNEVMKWITREKVKVDRVACPWLIKKFVDPEAEFLFVPAGKVLEVAAIGPRSSIYIEAVAIVRKRGESAVPGR